ncbi:predicted protein [Sclerotinia sclerotiorum 1980 UF-70]|uniref:Uncharacterized protein n=1 Tax=Sclerotinia sclerotiorum (strain ATCC 18683 / 1980 / Ss-1) TaxID=665079 RepID=A7EF68_SCLS1|nr:predicted protein [Sclerotinia sclerotiorum 1980 UF-70]EDO01484.1 predicted protein [Sclerotinia sclerotiorum 1980 UF-70]
MQSCQRCKDALQTQGYGYRCDQRTLSAQEGPQKVDWRGVETADTKKKNGEDNYKCSRGRLTLAVEKDKSPTLN